MVEKPSRHHSHQVIKVNVIGHGTKPAPCASWSSLEMVAKSQFFRLLSRTLLSSEAVLQLLLLSQCCERTFFEMCFPTSRGQTHGGGRSCWVKGHTQSKRWEVVSTLPSVRLVQFITAQQHRRRLTFLCQQHSSLQPARMPTTGAKEAGCGWVRPWAGAVRTAGELGAPVHLDRKGFSEDKVRAPGQAGVNSRHVY